MSSSRHDYDLRSRTKHGITTTTPNTIDKGKKPAPSIKRSRRAPRVPLSYRPRGPCDAKWSHKCALAALSSLNKVPKYQLIEALGCIEFRFSGLYHCNFIARPKKGSEAENKLCFAEVKTRMKKVGAGERFVITCEFACILGPMGAETGLNGCKVCTKFPDLVQHPEHGFTKIVYAWPFA